MHALFLRLLVPCLSRLFDNFGILVFIFAGHSFLFFYFCFFCDSFFLFFFCLCFFFFFSFSSLCTFRHFDLILMFPLAISFVLQFSWPGSILFTWSSRIIRLVGFGCLLR